MSNIAKNLLGLHWVIFQAYRDRSMSQKCNEMHLGYGDCDVQGHVIGSLPAKIQQYAWKEGSANITSYRASKGCQRDASVNVVNGWIFYPCMVSLSARRAPLNKMYYYCHHYPVSRNKF